MAALIATDQQIRRLFASARRFSSVVSWGRGLFGTLGDGTYAHRPQPLPIDFFAQTKPKQLACGWGNSALISDQGELYTWGWPLHIESVLHLGAQFDRFPAFVQEMQLRSWASILPARMNFRRAQTLPQLQPELAGRRFHSIAVGASFYIAVDEDGHAWTWGTNVHGQCGLNDAGGAASERQLVVDAPHQVVLPETEGGDSERFVAAAAGFNHALLLDSEGEVWVSGNAQRGQLGLPLTFTKTLVSEKLRSFTPMRATIRRFAAPLSAPTNAAPPSAPPSSQPDPAPASSNTTPSSSPSSSSDPSAAQRAAAAAARMGFKAPSVQSPSSSSSSSPTAPPPSDVRAVVDADGTVMLPVDSSPSLLRQELEHAEARAADMPRIVQVGAGFSHSVYLTEDGRVWLSGRGSTGVLGIERYPRATGAYNSAAPRSDGQPHQQNQGQSQGQGNAAIGTGEEGDSGLDASGEPVVSPESLRWVLSDQPVPLPLPALRHKRVKQIAVGQHHTVALTEDGEVWTWGMSRFGQCGRPASEQLSMVCAPTASHRFHMRLQFMPPGRVPLPPDVAPERVRAGFYHTAIITKDGQCFTFGPTTHEPSRPLPDHAVHDVAFGWRHAMAIVDPLVVRAQPDVDSQSSSSAAPTL